MYSYFSKKSVFSENALNTTTRLYKLPKWKCSRVVEAAKIIKVTPIEPHKPLEKAMLLLQVTPSLEIMVLHQYLATQRPQVGGYFVIYSDDIEAYVSADVFEIEYHKA